MQENIKRNQERYKYTQNRELSWLHFNQRVLEEADDIHNPPLERLKFVSIFTSNLDEFFMVRVGSLFDLSKVCPDKEDVRSGMTPSQQLNKIYSSVSSLIELKNQIYSRVIESLEENNICEVNFENLTQSEYKYVKKVFRNNMMPILSPIIIGSHHPVPHLNNKGLYVIALLQDKQKKNSIGLIPIPNVLPPYIKFSEKDSFRYILTENIILHWAHTLFGSYSILESCVICVTRNADISFDDDKFDDLAYDFRSRVTSILKSRDNLSVVRLEVSKQISESFCMRLAKFTNIGRNQIFIDTCPLKMKYVFQIESDLSYEMQSKLLYNPYKARWPEDIDRNYGIIEQVQKRDKLLFYPFDSTEPFLKLLSEAAERPDVISIKITIYRLASSSKIAQILCRAAENGKQIMVMMELRARFDEANNIEWSKMLENAGCQLIYGIEDFKCHSKICQITMYNHGKLNYITQIGTGNYNEKTNKMYTDLSYITASKEIGTDATLFFQNLLINKLDGEYQHLLVSPNGIERSVISLIDEQIKLREEGYICIKINSFTDCEVIDKLVEASQAGVEVQLIVRGICCILPGITGYTDNIHITSIVGRYLEHARIYCFGKDDDCKLYISSADFMERNLHHRVEVACPIYDKEIQNQLKWILKTQLADTEKASAVNFSGGYTRKSSSTSITENSQQEFMDNSIHKARSYAPPKPNAPTRFVNFLKRILDKY